MPIVKGFQYPCVIITTITALFKQLGESEAKLILNNENRMQELPFTQTLGPSL